MLSPPHNTFILSNMNDNLLHFLNILSKSHGCNRILTGFKGTEIPNNSQTVNMYSEKVTGHFQPKQKVRPTFVQFWKISVPLMILICRTDQFRKIWFSGSSLFCTKTVLHVQSLQYCISIIK